MGSAHGICILKNASVVFGAHVWGLNPCTTPTPVMCTHYFDTSLPDFINVLVVTSCLLTLSQPPTADFEALKWPIRLVSVLLPLPPTLCPLSLSLPVCTLHFSHTKHTCMHKNGHVRTVWWTCAGAGQPNGVPSSYKMRVQNTGVASMQIFAEQQGNLSMPPPCNKNYHTFPVEGQDV